MYQIKLVDEVDFHALITLHSELYDLLQPSFRSSHKVINLLDDLRKPDAFVFGLFYADTLVGYLSGSRLDDTTINFMDMYIRDGHRRQAKALYLKAEDFIKHKGYTAWETNIIASRASFAAGLGAKHKRSIYRKDL